MIGQRLTMVAHVERNSEAARDGWGQPAAPVWAAAGTLACFAWTSSANDVAEGKKIALVQRTRAMFALGADLAEGDRIARVTDRKGATLFAGPLRIEGAIAFKHNHLEVDLVRVG